MDRINTAPGAHIFSLSHNSNATVNNNNSLLNVFNVTRPVHLRIDIHADQNTVYTTLKKLIKFSARIYIPLVIIGHCHNTRNESNK